MPGAVVGDLEQRLASQLAEGGRVGVDPARVEEQRGGHVPPPQEADEGLVVAAAAGAAAGVEGQRDHPPRRGQLADHPRSAEAPGPRSEVTVAGHHLGPGRHRPGRRNDRPDRARSAARRRCGWRGWRGSANLVAAGHRGGPVAASQRAGRQPRQPRQHRTPARDHLPLISRPEAITQDIYHETALAGEHRAVLGRTGRGTCPGARCGPGKSLGLRGHSFYDWRPRYSAGHVGPIIEEPGCAERSCPSRMALGDRSEGMARAAEDAQSGNPGACRRR